MSRKVFEWLGLAVVLSGLLSVCCCAPRTAAYKSGQAAGTYIASNNRLYEDDGDFDIRKTIVYPAGETTFDPAINITNKQLALNRCSWCHECGFPQAWDSKHLGQPPWHPRYRGEAWGPIVQRMRVMDGSMLNEQIADRIYTYLRDQSLGVYDESKDTRGAVVHHVDKLPGNNVVIESPEHHLPNGKKDEGGSDSPPASEKH